MEFQPDKFVDDSAVGLEGFSVYLPLQQNAIHAERFHRYQTSHYRERRVREVPTREFSLWSFSDCRILSLMNLSYSWKMSLVFLAFRLVNTSRQRFPGS